MMRQLRKALEREGINYTENTINTFRTYRDLVLEWNQKINLTAIVDPDEFEVKHFVDSVAGAGFYNKSDIAHIIDVGTGTGFPGIPLAIIFPEKKFVLLDSLNKRIKVINQIVAELNLRNVTAIHGRAEDIASREEHREAYDICISRAVARLVVLSELCIPFVRTGGYFAAYKSTGIDDEVREAEKAISILGAELENIASHDFPTSSNNEVIHHQILYYEKIKKTPSNYPRKAGTPQKKPL